MAGREGGLNLEQSFISLAPRSLLQLSLRAIAIPVTLDTMDVAKPTFLAVPRMTGNINFSGEMLLCGVAHVHDKLPRILLSPSFPS